MGQGRDKKQKNQMVKARDRSKEILEMKGKSQESMLVFLSIWSSG